MNDAQELANLLDDAISMLKSGVVDDIENIATVADLKRSLTKSYTDRQDELKNIIQNLAQEVHALDVAANSTHHDEFLVAFSTLQQRRKFLMEEISRVESEAERQSQRIVSAKQEAIEVDRKLQEAQRIHAIDIPFTQKTLALYCTMSGIRWDYDAATVKGMIFGKSDIVPFDMNPNEKDPVEIANDLWELIDASNKPVEI
eukprot:TRINITY_DN12606_c0_g1_i1.p1 TRINITY_DN12606_c0_g1~~TRINITY_DN12606_c0_g1_i1.p1  ORF type:complete len:208 (-),score=58.57 TRINITY_DN12606_c0_g1_i1:77-679(-)